MNTPDNPSFFAKHLKRIVFFLVWFVPLGAFMYPRVLRLPAILLGYPTQQPPPETLPYIVTAVVWSAFVFVLWVVIGDDSPAHRANYARYKSIWCAFVIISLPLFLIGYLSYAGVASRVIALQGEASVVRDMISNSKDDNTSVEGWVNVGLQNSLDLADKFVAAETFKKDVDVKDFKTFERNAYGHAFQSDQYAVLIHRLTRTLVEKEKKLKEKGTEARGSSFEPLLAIVSELETTTKEIRRTSGNLFKTILAARSDEGSAEKMRDLNLQTVELINGYYQAKALIAGAKTTRAATQVSALGPFTLITILYSIFLLFPWVLLFLFLFRKQEYLVNQKSEVLEKMGLIGEFLYRSKPQEARKAVDRDADEQNRSVSAEIGLQAFRNCEYVVSLILFSAMTATMWYFFFYPDASAGLAQLISQGGGVTAFASYVGRGATPITFGFIGAYFFVIQMLLRRYFAGDLNPKAYTYAVVRLLTVFILGSVFQLAASHFTWGLTAASAITFAVGIFPMSGLRWISRWANDLAHNLNAPEYVDRFPLTELDGLNTWHEARLFEEKVENVQNLATAALDDLIVHTNFSPFQLVDWVDQAMLFIHTEDRWSGSFHAVGIRTATDLLSNACKTGETGDPQFDPDAASVLATAINAAQALTIPEPGHPRDAARLAAAKTYQSVADVAGIANGLHDLLETLTGDKPEAFDAILALRTKLSDVVKSTKDIKDERVKKLIEAAEKLPDGGDLVKQAKDASRTVEEATTMLCGKSEAAEQGANQLDRKQAETLIRLSEVKEKVGAVCTEADKLKDQIGAAVKIARQGAAGTTAQTEWAALVTALEVTEEARGQVLVEAQKAQEAAAPLTKEKPETLNLIIGLQAQLRALSEAAIKAQAMIKDAGAAAQELQASQPQLSEARKGLEAATESVNNLVTVASGLKDAGAALDIDTQTSMSGLPGLRDSIEKAWKAAKETRTRGQAAAGALQVASTPPQLTREILQAMVKTIENGPNIKPIESFRKQIKASH